MIVRSRRIRILFWTILLICIVLYAAPLLFTMNISLKSTKEFYRQPLALTSSWRFSNYTDAWTNGKLGLYMFNSIFYTVVSVFISMALTLAIAYPVSRQYIRGTKVWNNIFLCGMFLPNGLIPLFTIMLSLNLYDTRLGYLLTMTGINATAFYFFVSFIRGIPRDLDEVAVLDGCGYVRYLFTILTVLARPAIAAMSVLSALSNWNDIINSIIFLASEENFTIMRGLYYFEGKFTSNWPLLTAGMLIIAAPIILVFICGQRFIVEGIVAGSIKG